MDHAWIQIRDNTLAAHLAGIPFLRRAVRAVQQDLRHDRRRHRRAHVVLSVRPGLTHWRGAERRNRARISVWQERRREGARRPSALVVPHAATRRDRRNSRTRTNHTEVILDGGALAASDILFRTARVLSTR